MIVSVTYFNSDFAIAQYNYKFQLCRKSYYNSTSSEFNTSSIEKCVLIVIHLRSVVKQVCYFSPFRLSSHVVVDNSFDERLTFIFLKTKGPIFGL